MGGAFARLLDRPRCLRAAALAALIWCPAGQVRADEASANASSGGQPSAHHATAHDTPVVLAPGYADLEFDAPAPGTYRLPPLGQAADGRVVDSQGQALQLHDLMSDKLVLLSFIYTSCSDVNGCPLATHVFNRVATALGQSSDLSGRVRLLSLSFDPDNDSPAVMRRYGAPFQRPGVDWRFLTTSGTEDLDPILDRYDQWVIRDYDEAGNPLGTISHVLRVYLIDTERRIRNIYSVSFLHPDTIASDLRTLVMESVAFTVPDEGGSRD